MFNEQFTYLARTVFGNLLIRTLISLRDLEFFISVGTLPHSFGPIEDAISMSYLSVHSMLQLQLN